MAAQGNDVWTAEFTPPEPGRYRCTVTAWVDHFESWRRELERRDDLDDIRLALKVGGALISEAAARAPAEDAAVLDEWAARLAANAVREPAADAASLKALALDPARAKLMARHADRSLAVSASFELFADRKRAAFSSWYELFPRSASAEPARHGSFKDVEARLPYVAQMGFDVVYFPPIQPIGRVNRKGANNALEAAPDDVGSPWAIGSAEGGHKDILPQLGSIADFKRLIARARELGMEIALDLAFQCAPDHPYVAAHPQWFRHRPDGSVQYAENPPKKYQDIYPFDFETEDWRALWDELESVVQFWIAQGVRIFRVDNPHTKPFAFWEWIIGEVQRLHPDVLFLAEAFTRPKVMHRLAKLGFTQSYTYFTWRNTKRELTEYFTELARGPGRQYFRPNVWPNTPDILHETLQSGLRGIRRALGARRHAVRQLWHLRPHIRAHGERAAGTRERGIPGFREIPVAPLEAGPSRQPEVLDRQDQSHPPRPRGAAVGRVAALLPARQRAVDRLSQEPRGIGRYHPRDREPGSSQRAIRLAGARPRRLAARRRGALPGARSAERAALRVAGREKLRDARPKAPAGACVQVAAALAHRA
jgi:starch synthase (maltosyl-transferring)